MVVGAGHLVDRSYSSPYMRACPTKNHQPRTTNQEAPTNEHL